MANQQQTILITGCSSGIGRSCAQKLHALGHRVIATARNPKDVADLKAQGLDSFELDLTCPDSIKTALKAILAEYSSIDVLFNNAGYGQPGAIEDISRQALRDQFETNVFGTVELTNLVIAQMRRQGHGKIIINSSVLGIVSMAFRGAYNASKYALEGMADTLRLELGTANIHVSLIEPGPITSKFRENAYLKFKANIDIGQSPWKHTYQTIEARLSSTSDGRDPFTLGPEAVTDKVLKIMKSARPKPRYYVTMPTYLFGLLRRLLPSRGLDWIMRRVMKSELEAYQEVKSQCS